MIPWSVPHNEILSDVPEEEINNIITELVSDPTNSWPVSHSLSSGIEVQFCRGSYGGDVVGILELHIDPAFVDEPALVALEDAQTKHTQHQRTGSGSRTDVNQTMQDLPTKASEIGELAPIAIYIRGVVRGCTEQVNETIGAPVIDSSIFSPGSPQFVYIGSTEESTNTEQFATGPYSYHRDGSFDRPRHVFMMPVPLGYSWSAVPNTDSGKDTTPTAVSQRADGVWNTGSEEPLSVGDVFYNKKQELYAWIVGIDTVSHVFLQLEDGTFTRQEVAGGEIQPPFESTELPEDYSSPVPHPRETCSEENHNFTPDGDLPHSYKEFEESICVECGLAVPTLIELYHQWPHNSVEFECIQCDHTGQWDDLIDYENKLEETAICDGCWNKSLTRGGSESTGTRCQYPRPGVRHIL